MRFSQSCHWILIPCSDIVSIGKVHRKVQEFGRTTIYFRDELGKRWLEKDKSPVCPGEKFGVSTNRKMSDVYPLIEEAGCNCSQCLHCPSYRLAAS